MLYSLTTLFGQLSLSILYEISILEFDELHYIGCAVRYIHEWKRLPA